MTNSALPRLSLWRETFKEISSNLKLMWPWIIGLAIVVTGLQFLTTHLADQSAMNQRLQENPQLFKQHPEFVTSYFKTAGVFLVIYIPLSTILEMATVYGFAVAHLQRVVTSKPPTHNVKDFLYWARWVIWKYLKPVVWCLIPFIGPFFYIRSVVRYALVSPLALFHREPTLKRSWQLTKNNWWRLFGVQLGIMLLISLGVLVIAIIPLGILWLITHNSAPTIFDIAVQLAFGLQMSLSLMVTAIYPCTAYRVLLTEQRNTTSTPNTPV